mgnify:CR=1 FL=1
MERWLALLLCGGFISVCFARPMCAVLYILYTLCVVQTKLAHNHLLSLSHKQTGSFAVRVVLVVPLSSLLSPRLLRQLQHQQQQQPFYNLQIKTN